MSTKEAEALWQEAKGGAGAVAAGDKFMVQTAVVDEAFFTENCTGKNEQNMSTALADLWKKLEAEDKAAGKAGSRRFRSSKMRARFDFGSALSMEPALSTIEASPTSAFSEPPYKQTTGQASSAGAAEAAKASEAAEAAPPQNPEEVFAQLTALRKKLDDLAEYQVRTVAGREAGATPFLLFPSLSSLLQTHFPVRHRSSAPAPLERRGQATPRLQTAATGRPPPLSELARPTPERALFSGGPRRREELPATGKHGDGGGGYPGAGCCSQSRFGQGGRRGFQRFRGSSCGLLLCARRGRGPPGFCGRPDLRVEAPWGPGG